MPKIQPNPTDLRPSSESVGILPKEVSEKYELPEGTLSKFACAEFGEVDLTTINLDYADQLAEKGYLKKR